MKREGSSFIFHQVQKEIVEFYGSLLKIKLSVCQLHKAFIREQNCSQKFKSHHQLPLLSTGEYYSSQLSLQPDWQLHSAFTRFRDANFISHPHSNVYQLICPWLFQHCFTPNLSQENEEYPAEVINFNFLFVLISTDISLNLKYQTCFSINIRSNPFKAVSIKRATSFFNSP